MAAKDFDSQQAEKQALDAERRSLLETLDDLLETPLLVLSFGWLVLVIVDLVWGLEPILQTLMNVIWTVFIVDFLVRFMVAPAKIVFLRQNWLTVISLLLPAFRIFRAVRIFRIVRTGTRATRLVSLVGSANRGMRTLRASMGRRGLGYVLGLTLLVTLLGAAGVYAFEGAPGAADGPANYGEALWWTAMLMTTLGSDYVPQTGEGRILMLLLATYAFAIFGYVTAALASYLVGREATQPHGAVAGGAEVAALRQEIAMLRTELARGREEQEESAQSAGFTGPRECAD